MTFCEKSGGAGDEDGLIVKKLKYTLELHGNGKRKIRKRKERK